MAALPPTGYSAETAARLASLPHLNRAPCVAMTAEVLAAFLAGLAERSRNLLPFVDE